MAGRYRVVGVCAPATTETPHGIAITYHYQGSYLPAAATPEEIEHLLSVRLIERVDADAPSVPEGDDGPTGGDEQVPSEDKATGGGGEPSAQEETPGEGGEPVEPDEAVAEQAERRKAAREKLAAMGGKAPDGRASHDVLVEYLAAQGGSYDDLIRAEKADLVEMVKSRQG
ncbi:hypothetical protein ABZ671_00805 [Micromonospora sp. NPDC006766]|uniref:hypothetical protein n=1 Tax=Micromonospora sp. NPDC006766 TaxID=3154778 RepID=UPI0033EC183D